MILVTALCLAAAVNAASDADWFYAEIFAKKTAFPLTAGAYTDKKGMWQYCLNRVDEEAVKSFFAALSGKKTGAVIKAPCEFDNEKFTCKAYTAVLPTRNAIVISIRGTDQGFAQLVREAWRSIGGKVHWFAGGSVSHYFSEAFINLWSAGIEQQIKDHLAKYPGYDIWVTGHSLGGAIANLAASWVKNLEPARHVRLVTYGAPRVGDETFKNTLESQIQYIYRVTHRKDPVPHIPNVGYYHAGKEIYYKNEMEWDTESCDVAADKNNCFVQCEQSEDKKCAMSITVNWLSPATDDHNHYYGSKYISKWGDIGCP